ncbi:hypothetical protein [Dokdonella sp.]|uniref:hypothetical protein n=1 Tax=Dokdonella sp. TaxID=2291710 RepID=UPI001B1EBBE4|nr:hypothetical protein [Dokdonella sp.]MBO9664089.1 hypothetical protein [Dokdonella sp.]
MSSVVEIRCPQCQSDFVDSRADWKEEDVARCPKCGTNVAVRGSEIESAGNGHVVHAQPTVPTPTDRTD